MQESDETNVKNMFNHDKGQRKKFLIFSLNGDKFGIPLASVKEVLGLTEITKVPQVPSFFTGLINLRGRIISVMDLRKKMGVPASDFKAKKTSIIIVDIDDFLLGAIVDDVKEVVNLETSQIEHDLDIAGSSHKEFICGVVKSKDKGLTLLLDIAKTLSSTELKRFKKESKVA